jgi:hypothetical protein
MIWLIGAGYGDAFYDPTVGGPPASGSASVAFIIVMVIFVLVIGKWFFE